MFKIESYVTPILLSYVDKYVRDFKPADAQVSLWGGGVALHNLVLKADVLQQEVALPFTLVSGRIHELLIQVPWTKIMSEPIVVTIDTIECILSLRPPASSDENVPQENPVRRTTVVEAPPGYMQALVRRIVSNIALRVHHLIVKYVHDDIVLSLNVKHLAVDSAGINWEPAFADIDQTQPVIRRLVRLDDLTLCLDRTDSDGKIRFYQEPLLYRCQLDLRVLTKLVSANTRRATSLSIQVKSSKLAWGVTSEQLSMLLRLVRERAAAGTVSAPATKLTVSQSTPLHATSSNQAEPARSESWSEWAWSWLPTWADRDAGAEEAIAAPTPVPLHVTAYFDSVSLVFKVMELESTRKRARSVLELRAKHACVRGWACLPTTLRLRAAVRQMRLESRGRCVCGHVDNNMLQDQHTVYLDDVKTESEEEDEWCWPEEDFNAQKVEVARVADEELRATPTLFDHTAQSDPSQIEAMVTPETEDSDELWEKMKPVIFLEYSHDRSPNNPAVNPFENPPIDFQFSDWVEACNLKVVFKPMQLRICMGLIHRLSALRNIINDQQAAPPPDLPRRTLTVEECEALSENIPQRRISLLIHALKVRVVPWDHSLKERPVAPPLMLEIQVPKAHILVTGPLYPHRVCSAACQLPEDSGPLWQGARLHMTAAMTSLSVHILAEGSTPLPCGGADVRFVAHTLLHSEYFTERESQVFQYCVKIHEANACGSAARLQAAWQVLSSMISKKLSIPLRYTTLPQDALHDDDAVTIDVTMEEFTSRGYFTPSITTHIIVLQSLKATIFHAPNKKEDMKQAWLFSGPDSPTTSPYLRIAVQWCSRPVPHSLDYIGAWSEPSAVCLDPLFMAWLAYKPLVKPTDVPCKSATSLQQVYKRRTTPPSSSGRGFSRGSGSGAELVHAARPRSQGSESEPSDRKEKYSSSVPDKPQSKAWDSDRIVALYDRLKHTLVNIEAGMVIVYVTKETASAVDCATARDAMERHTMDHDVLALSLGRLGIFSSAMLRHLWNEIRHDGPTFVSPKPDGSPTEIESFPWKLSLSDVSCCTLEFHTKDINLIDERSIGKLRSHLKVQNCITSRVILDHTTTTLTLSVVTKSVTIKKFVKKNEVTRTKELTQDEKKMKYFQSGLNFKPSTLREFVRGPKLKSKVEASSNKQESTSAADPFGVSEDVVQGPMVSMGAHLHADTPPVIVRIDQNQVHIVGASIHCLTHLLNMILRPPISKPRGTSTSTPRSFIRTVTELEEREQRTPSEETQSENPSELIPIFEAYATPTLKLKFFFWFQWVVSRATMVFTTPTVKLAFDVDDIISTIDLQEHYNQFKVKVSSASVRHYHRHEKSPDWKAGVLGGRVLEAREPANAAEDGQFISVTVTQAQISNLPESWKEELHPKLLQQKSNMETLWEIYVTLAPLEAVIQPKVLEQIATLHHEMAPNYTCPLPNDSATRTATTFQWPMCYVTAGGLRLLVTQDEPQLHDSQVRTDDTFLFLIGKLAVSPHPENPICRRPAQLADSTWAATGNYEGRQYEIVVRSVAIQSTKFKQIMKMEISEINLKKACENPALKWTQSTREDAIMTPMLHSVDISCVLAPVHYINGLVAAGPAVELNILSDCSLELSVDQLCLLRRVISDFTYTLRDRAESAMTFNACPYSIIMNQTRDDTSTWFNADSFDSNLTDPGKSQLGAGRCTIDSGVDTATSQSSNKGRFDESQMKKAVSIVFSDDMGSASEHLEVFVTMGTVELSLYTEEYDDPVIDNLKDASQPEASKKAHDDNDFVSPQTSGHSLTKTTTDLDALAKGQIDMFKMPEARKGEGVIPLVHLTLYQPNLYYWKRRTQKSFQVSLFNAYLTLGTGMGKHQTELPLLTTAPGAPDPVTEIPPTLATLKYTAPTASLTNSTMRGTVKLDVERPVQIQVSTNRLIRIQAIIKLLKKKLNTPRIHSPRSDSPFLYILRRYMNMYQVESGTIQTSQISVRGSQGTVGWDASSLQLATSGRPERIVGRALLTALLVYCGGPDDSKHPLLHPLMVGLELNATWDAWRRTEGVSPQYPTTRLLTALDRVIVELRPSDLAAVTHIRKSIATLMNQIEEEGSPHPIYERFQEPRFSDDTTEILDDHYYKDDLRSGAFKIVTSSHLPMAYQVTLHGSAISWKYPHPRSITRIVAYPLPGLDTETKCVLEVFNTMTSQWDAHRYVNLPVSEPTEVSLYVAAPAAVFARVWRFRVCYDVEKEPAPFEFDINRYTPKAEPLTPEPQPDMNDVKIPCSVTAEQLSGVVRVDSYFAPRQLPKTRLTMRCTAFEVHIHNLLPCLTSQATTLEGYYVSKPLMRSHRVLTLRAVDITARALMFSSAGNAFTLSSYVDADILECSTGTMEQLVSRTRVHASLTQPHSRKRSSSRVFAGDVRVSLHVSRLKTLTSLQSDWNACMDQYIHAASSDCSVEIPSEILSSKREVADVTAAALDGRVSIWIHNSCGSALRVGQEETDEVVPLGPGARLAYRWRCPYAPKKIRIALTGPSQDWHWSSSIPLKAGKYRVRLEEPDATGNPSQSSIGAYLYCNVSQSGARRTLMLAGRLVLANMMRMPLLYKVRARCTAPQNWRNLSSGELPAESVGRSVVCGVDAELMLKIKLTTHDTGWSGDIPLKECPKENVPWLVKVPSEGDKPYVAVWCRVVRARSDGRIIATIWPLYMLHSHLPLDTDVLITTQSSDANTGPNVEQIPPLVQSAPGRGAITHLLPPGTTAAMHQLSFQYRNIDCPVTRDAVPLHYGVTDVSVFDKRAPVNSIDEVVNDTLAWLEKAGRNAYSPWPYSIVTKHWPASWRPALIQPRCDVTVRYQPIRAGGGCSLEVQLCPVVMLCNASPLALTLRAHDAAPLCKLEPGNVISPPSNILVKPFFLSLEIGRETFVSGQLEVCTSEPGRYGSPPPGSVALDHEANFNIHCGQKVALLTMYYEIKDDINVVGLSSTYMLINRLQTQLLVSPIVIPPDENDVRLKPKSYKLVAPTKQGSLLGTPLGRFWVSGRWHSSLHDPRAFLALTLDPATPPTPVPLNGQPRKALALTPSSSQLTQIPIVVTQQKCDGRWVVTVARDPCPQFAIYNRSRTALAVAQPQSRTDPAPSATMAVPECDPVTWWCVVPPDTTTYYSTPDHNARFPPAAPPPSITFLTFGNLEDGPTYKWCSPVAISPGEQLVQLSGGATIKLRVHPHPHSTLLDLLDIDENDISASDIRRRLQAPYDSSSLLSDTDKSIIIPLLDPEPNLYRSNAIEKLLTPRPSILKSEPKLMPNEGVISRPSEPEMTRSSKSQSKPQVTLNTGSYESSPAMPNDVDPLDTASLDESFISSDLGPGNILAGKFTRSNVTITRRESETCASYALNWQNPGEEEGLPTRELLRLVFASVVLELAATDDTAPLLALYADRVAAVSNADHRGVKTTVTVGDIQVDNVQYESGQFDFAVVATTRGDAVSTAEKPSLWDIIAQGNACVLDMETAKASLIVRKDSWRVNKESFSEFTELEISIGPLALYIEDAYVTALVELTRLATSSSPPDDSAAALAEAKALITPIRLRSLVINPLDLTLTLHTAVRMYIALDQSPLRLSAFRLTDMMTSTERLTHALTVHYLSAAILGAGWVVGGLELLGAPGALAARVGGATGGVRGIASTAAAALLRSLSAWAGSLARNLDLLAGDEEHARRAAAARRRPPPSFMAGLAAGITNFAINILGAVGGLAHHPLVGVAVGETGSGATALRRGLLGALTKPLSATADLVAYAGHGLLRQTGWDPVPQPRPLVERDDSASGWRRDCVRWTFRLADLAALAGFEAAMDDVPVHLLLTHKFLVVAKPDSEKILEMIDYKNCILTPYQGQIIELRVTHRRGNKSDKKEESLADDDEFQISAAAMARVARYTGAEGTPSSLFTETRPVYLLPAPGISLALYAALAAHIHHNSATHLPQM